MTTNYRIRDTHIRSGRPINTYTPYRPTRSARSLTRTQQSQDHSRNDTALLVEDRPSRTGTSGRAIPTVPTQAPPRRRMQRKAGSQQVFSNRGKRIVRQRVDPSRIRFVLALTLLLGAGVFIAMMLSKISTEQSFEMQELQHHESTLQNQVETLNRDLQNAAFWQKMNRATYTSNARQAP